MDPTEAMTMAKRINPSHPGEVLKEDYMAPLGMTAYRLTKDIGDPAIRIASVRWLAAVLPRLPRSA